MGVQRLFLSGIRAIDTASMELTKHAVIRVQQRGVRLDLLNCLLTYGHHEPDHKGCHIVTFDEKAIEELTRHEPQELKAKATGSRNLYAVVDSDGIVVTAGHRVRRVPRDMSLSSLRPGRSRSPRAIRATGNLFHH